MITSTLLLRASKLQEKIEKMQKELNSILAGQEIVFEKAAKPRKMTKKGREAIAQAQRDRHARDRQSKTLTLVGDKE
jgi:hypothetical protein